MGEWTRVIDFLDASECKRYLGLEKGEAKFICQGCHAIDLRPDPPIKLGVLRPDSSSTTLFCLACGETADVLRAPCRHCSYDVLSREGACLSCDQENDLES